MMRAAWPLGADVRTPALAPLLGSTMRTLLDTHLPGDTTGEPIAPSACPSGSM